MRGYAPVPLFLFTGIPHTHVFTFFQTIVLKLEVIFQQIYTKILKIFLRYYLHNILSSCYRDIHLDKYFLDFDLVRIPVDLINKIESHKFFVRLYIGGQQNISQVL